eukprot:TRINITY_DN1662_c0_g3_i2.p1 TRINITY_DN1662_c0_g3~~TRINITY_DN1662_c0_g3_i2.p1  ORF type:complete len:393 (-),score=46.22 TRINITY_DN1662_c0_g3_i2:109-1287(-)
MQNSTATTNDNSNTIVTPSTTTTEGTHLTRSASYDATLNENEENSSVEQTGTLWRAKGREFGTHIFFSGCIILFYLLSGIIQERILTKSYGQNKSTVENLSSWFDSTLFLVLVNRLMRVFAALIILSYKNESIASSFPISKYAIISIPVVISSFLQFEALKYLNFPAQSILKFSKLPLSVMFNSLRFRERNLLDICVSTVVIASISVYFKYGDVSSVEPEWENGVVCIVMFMFLEYVFTVFQSRLLKGCNATLNNQMLWLNLCCTALALLLSLVSGQLNDALMFVADYPSLLLNTLGLALSTTLAQLAVNYMARIFGSSTMAMMAMRNVLGILLSIVLFDHQLTAWQWCAVFLCSSIMLLHHWLLRRTSVNRYEDSGSQTLHHGHSIDEKLK